MFTVATISPSTAPDAAPELHHRDKREDALDLAWRLAHGYSARPLWNNGWVWSGCKPDDVDGVPIGGYHLSPLPEVCGAGVVVFSDDLEGIASEEIAAGAVDPCS